MAADIGLATTCQQGSNLLCFDWKYTDIQAELANIAQAGFTSVQTSVAQDDCSGGSSATETWYWLYQPAGFTCTSNALGTAAELKALCAAAESYGVKVIVDVVANHTKGDLSYCESTWQNTSLYHSDNGSIDYSNRWQITHYQIGMYDLASESSTVYQAVASYINTLKSMGVSGIRWDAAKHIDLPSEYGSQFWPNAAVSGLYHYGEVLDGPMSAGTSDATNASLMAEYQTYMSVTDNAYGRSMCNTIASGSVFGSYGYWSTASGVSSEGLVYWAESHDTYCNDGESTYTSENVIDRTYALLGCRDGETALYLSRPYATSNSSIYAGVKGSTHFTCTQVAAVNHFRNAMVGQKDYYVAGSNAMAVCRGNGTSIGGAVVVTTSSSGSWVSISNGGSYVPAGTYTDEITGNTFTVTASTISGTVGSTGIAVFYSGSEVSSGDGDTDVDDSSNEGSSNSAYTTPSSGVTTSTDGTYTVYLDNSVGSYATPYIYVWNSGSNTQQLGSWPGTQMLYDETTGYYYYTFTPTDATNLMVIFSDSGNNQTQTADLVLYNNGIYTSAGYTYYDVDLSSGQSATPMLSLDHAERQIECIYSLSGQRQTQLRRGLNVVRYTDGTIEKIIVK